MKNKLNLAGLLWLSGFVAGVVLVGRWRRLGGTEIDDAPPESVSDDDSPAPANLVQRVAAPILVGAKTDLRKVGDATKKVTHRGGCTVETPTPQS